MPKKKTRPRRVFKNANGRLFILKNGKKYFLNSNKQSQNQIVNVILGDKRYHKRMKSTKRKTTGKKNKVTFSYPLFNTLKENTYGYAMPRANEDVLTLLRNGPKPVYIPIATPVGEKLKVNPDVEDKLPAPPNRGTELPPIVLKPLPQQVPVGESKSVPIGDMFREKEKLPKPEPSTPEKIKLRKKEIEEEKKNGMYDRPFLPKNPIPRPTPVSPSPIAPVTPSVVTGEVSTVSERRKKQKVEDLITPERKKLDFDSVSPNPNPYTPSPQSVAGDTSKRHTEEEEKREKSKEKPIKPRPTPSTTSTDTYVPATQKVSKTRTRSKSPGSVPFTYTEFPSHNYPHGPAPPPYKSNSGQYTPAVSSVNKKTVEELRKDANDKNIKLKELIKEKHDRDKYSPADIANAAMKGKVISNKDIKKAANDYVRDIDDEFNEKNELKHPINRPKPSFKTPEELEQHSKIHKVASDAAKTARIRNDAEQYLPDSIKNVGLQFVEKDRQAKDELHRHGGGKYANWKKGLYDDEIEKIMEKHDGHRFVPVIMSDQIPEIAKYVTPKTREFGFVINNQDSSKSGEHWMSCYINKDRGSIDFYDPLVSNPTPRFMHDIKKVIDRMHPDFYFKFKTNMVKQQANNTDDCGFFCCKFLLDMFRGKPFRQASGFDDCHIGGQKMIEKFKKYI